MAVDGRDDLIECPFCADMDEVWACSLCGGRGVVPKDVAAECMHPGCEEAIYEDGPLCQKHGCVKCGAVIMADYEDERLCDECGDKKYRWN